jgi:hypothetical protein
VERSEEANLQVYTYASLSEEDLAQVQQFERQTSKKALVFQQVDAEPEVLSERELALLQSLEDRLGYLVIVVR